MKNIIKAAALLLSVSLGQNAIALNDEMQGRKERLQSIAAENIGMVEDMTASALHCVRQTEIFGIDARDSYHCKRFGNDEVVNQLIFNISFMRGMVEDLIKAGENVAFMPDYWIYRYVIHSYVDYNSARNRHLELMKNTAVITNDHKAD